MEKESKYGIFYCEFCDINISKQNKSRHLKSKLHKANELCFIRIKKFVMESF